MTIEETRAQAVSKLGELSKIPFKKPTAMELHSIRPMLSRVQRQEQRRHKMAVITQKKKLTKDISDLDKYLQSVTDYETYLASLPQEPINGGISSVSSVSLITPQQAAVAPIVLSIPNIVFKQQPILKRTRLSRHKRGGRY